MATNLPIQIGTLRAQKEGYQTFIPEPFPPNSGLTLPNALLQKASRATLLLGKLDGITQLLPDVDFFLMMYIRKDATSSSQIEGTKATMIDALDAEGGTETHISPDVDDILHYIAALKYGLTRLKGFPLSLRFLCEIHRELMQGARTTHFADQGSFRRSQNWIGGTTPSNAHFVPPPPHEMQAALADLEKFLHADDDFVPLIKAGLLHAQFETIHPFLDGNGRTGRLLITFFLWLQHLLDRPVLFLSSYFKKHQKVYYDRLNGYHDGQVIEWLDFFLDGIIETAESAVLTAQQITTLREEDMRKIQKLGKASTESAMRVLPQLFGQPIINVAKVSEWTGFSRPGAQKVIDRLLTMGILERRDERRYGRSFIYRRYTKIFTEE